MPCQKLCSLSVPHGTPPEQKRVAAVMGRDTHSKHRRGRTIPFVPLHYELLNSMAYKKLSASTGKALPFFLAKVKIDHRSEDRYRETFSLTYSELTRRMGISQTTCAKIIRELVTIGFIDPVAKGGLNSQGKSSNKFRLSRRWEEYGTSKHVTIDWNRFGT